MHLIGFGVWWVRFATAEGKELIIKLTAPIFGCFLNAYDFVRDRVNNLFSRYR